MDFFGLDSILTIFADSPPGDPIGHAFIGITENGATEYIGQWPKGGFTGDQLKEVATTGLPGTLDYNDTSHLGASSTVSRNYDLTDHQTTDLRKYIKEYDASNRQMAIT